jgi:hypothetical protein
MIAARAPEHLRWFPHDGYLPAVPSCILDSLREEFLALLPPRVDRHPLGCHRRRIDDRIVFDKIVAALVFGCG